jgi:DNA/RNA-binding domain of Phe-tRNA-synthetase-like protein
MRSIGRPFSGRLADGNFVNFEVNCKGLSLAAIQMVDLRVSPSLPDFEKYEQEVFGRIRAQLTLDDLKDDSIFRSFRDLYWAFGMDPTKLRVSSEALLRRILVGQNLWRVNSVVDVANLASVVHKLPIGLTDVSKINGKLTIRTAKKGEAFRRIGGEVIECRGREIVLADDEKIVCYGFATHDSDPTRVTDRSTEVLLLIYGSPGVGEDNIQLASSTTVDMVEQWLDCRITGLGLFRSS